MKNLTLFLPLLALAFTGNALADIVTCESRQNQRQECAMDTHGEVRVVRQLSKTKCVEGQNWGVSRYSIWVDQGCRATFESDGAAAYGIVDEDEDSSGGPKPEAIAACNAIEDWYGQVVESTPLKPGAWEIILMYEPQGKYVCNVEGTRVTYFERLNKQ
jgi:hypothetical protein